MTSEFGLRKSVEQGIATLLLAGELDIATVALVEGAAAAVLNDGAISMLRLELTEVTFIDSTGLGCLVRLHSTAEHNEKVLRLTGLAPSVRRVIELGGLASLLDVD